MEMKKSQASMEFLMTYGWAIIVVLIAIGTLSYFGVLDFAKILPEKCTSTTGLECMGLASITGHASSVEFVIKNNLGVPIELIDTSVGTPVQVEGQGICAATLTNVSDPGTGNTGDINLSFGGTPGTPLDYNGSRIFTNDLIRIKILCPQPLTDANRFKETIILPYRNTETGLKHFAKVSITGKVN